MRRGVRGVQGSTGRSLGWAFGLLSLAGACSATPEPAAPTGETAPPVAAPPPGPKLPCPDKDACYAAGRAAGKAGDEARAKELYAAGCDLGSGGACVDGAALHEDEPDRGMGMQIRGCTLGAAVGCFNAAEMLRNGPRVKEALAFYAKACAAPDPGDLRLRGLACERGAHVAYEAGDFGRAAELGALGCNDEVASACDTLAVLYANGEGVAKDMAKAASLFERGCKGGDNEACDHQKAAAAALDPLAVEGANLKMTSISVEGFAMSDMACKLKGGGLEMLVAGPVLAAVIGKKKAALNACAPGGAAVTLRWKIDGGHVVEALASTGDKKVEACIAKVVRSSIATFDATCRASFKLGRR
jgi:hypothetical protein